MPIGMIRTSVKSLLRVTEPSLRLKRDISFLITIYTQTRQNVQNVSFVHSKKSGKNYQLDYQVHIFPSDERDFTLTLII